MTITPELKAAVERAGDEPIRLEDPETKTTYLVIREEVYRESAAARGHATTLTDRSTSSASSIPTNEDPRSPADPRPPPDHLRGRRRGAGASQPDHRLDQHQQTC